MGDVEEELLRQLGLHPGAARSRPPTTALTLEDWARGASPVLTRPKPMADPRATGARETESRAVKERAVQSKALLSPVWGSDSKWTKSNVKPLRNRAVSAGEGLCDGIPLRR